MKLRTKAAAIAAAVIVVSGSAIFASGSAGRWMGLAREDQPRGGTGEPLRFVRTEAGLKQVLYQTTDVGGAYQPFAVVAGEELRVRRMTISLLNDPMVERVPGAVTITDPSVRPMFYCQFNYPGTAEFTFDPPLTIVENTVFDLQRASDNVATVITLIGTEVSSRGDSIEAR